ncbi:MAG: hypothetical protein QXQ02_03310 [Halobacteria archaeon]
MSERESSAIEDITRGVAKLMALPFSETFDQVLIESLPKKYAQTAEHLINARIEFLSALKSLLDLKIERLKEVREKIKEKAEVGKKEKVQVE